MKHYSATRIAAVAVLVCLLGSFAMPVAAAGSSFSATLGVEGASHGFLVHWLQRLWAGWLELVTEPDQPAEIGRLYDKHNSNSEPDGIAATSGSFIPLGSFESGTF